MPIINTDKFRVITCLKGVEYLFDIKRTLKNLIYFKEPVKSESFILKETKSEVDLNKSEEEQKNEQPKKKKKST